MSDIFQMGTILAVAAALFLGLGYWFAAGRFRDRNAAAERDDLQGAESSPDQAPADSPELKAARNELEAAGLQITELEADLAKARAQLAPTTGATAGPAPTLGSTIDPELGPVFAVRPEATDDLTVIRGIGKALSRQLNDLGIYTLSQIANWDKGQLEAVSVRLAFKDRIQRDDWVGQAKRLV